jgi:transcriptional regulator of heat shock response
MSEDLVRAIVPAVVAETDRLKAEIERLQVIIKDKTDLMDVWRAEIERLRARNFDLTAYIRAQAARHLEDVERLQAQIKTEIERSRQVEVSYRFRAQQDEAQCAELLAALKVSRAVHEGNGTKVPCVDAAIAKVEEKVNEDRDGDQRSWNT